MRCCFVVETQSSVVYMLIGISAKIISTTLATGCETSCIERKKSAESEKPTRIKGNARSPVALKIISAKKGMQEMELDVLAAMTGV